jgi:hypothetical protein
VQGLHPILHHARVKVPKPPRTSHSTRAAAAAAARNVEAFEDERKVEGDDIEDTDDEFDPTTFEGECNVRVPMAFILLSRFPPLVSMLVYLVVWMIPPKRTRLQGS